MAHNSAPRFLTPKNSIARGQISVANTARDGTGTIVDVYVAGSEGGEVEMVVVKAQGVTTAGMVRLFIHNGSAWRLYTEIDVTAVAAPGATTKTFSAEFIPTKRLIIPTGWKLGAAPHNAEIFEVHAHGGDY